MRATIFALILSITTPAYGNPYDWPVKRVIDGDTVEVLVDFLPQPLRSILSVIDNIKTDGGTPLSTALEKAAEALDYEHKKATIVVLTDGDDSCGRDTCKTAKDLKAKSSDLTIHVIGLEGGFDELKNASCIADETGGVFVDTTTYQGLKDALNIMLVCPSIS